MHLRGRLSFSLWARDTATSLLRFGRAKHDVIMHYSCLCLFSAKILIDRSRCGAMIGPTYGFCGIFEPVNWTCVVNRP